MAKRDEFLAQDQGANLAELVEAADRIVDEAWCSWCGRCDEMVALPEDLDSAIGAYRKLRGNG